MIYGTGNILIMNISIDNIVKDGMADGSTELESVSDNLVFLDNELEEL